MSNTEYLGAESSDDILILIIMNLNTNLRLLNTYYLLFDTFMKSVRH